MSGYVPTMGKQLSDDEIKNIIKEENVQFIRVQFVDVLGHVKNMALPASQIDRILNNEIMFDGSSVKGFRNIETSDMYFYPDKSTFTILPWRSKSEGKVARLICDTYNPDGTPFEGCPRNNLKRLMAEAKELGYTMNVGPECEFFLFKKDEEGRPTTTTHDYAGYYDLGPDDLGEDVRADIVHTLHEMGFEVEASHHEVAKGQHEVDFKYADALTTADNVVTFKAAVRAIAARHGLHATFMPKPIFGINGSGMHVNFSLSKDGDNAFLDESKPHQLSQDAMYSIGGILKNIKSITAITNPTINSYKRLVPGYEAPVYLAWSLSNRSALLRVPAKRGKSTRVELRSPDPSSNPYLAFAAILAAALDGIKNKIDAPASVDANIYHLTEKERKRAKIDSLPGTLNEAIEHMEKSNVAKEALGEHIFNEFINAKKLEWDDYRTKVTPWEIEKYLNNY